jgi:RNA polymerase-binding transcription factor DksA
LEQRQRDQLRLALELRRKALLEELKRDALRDAQELRDIEAAFRRLDDDNYGVCAACGAGIGFERLQAEPGTARCAECQRRYDKVRRRS